MADDDRALLQRLVDIEAIKQLKARYFRAIDTKQWDDFGEVFATDARLEVPEADMVVDGGPEIVASVSGALPRRHHRPPRPHAGDRADRDHGARHVGDVRLRGVERRQDADRLGLQGYGHYREEYVREDGRWRIARSRLERLRVDPLGAGLPSIDG